MPDTKALRWRVEHAQHLSLADIPRFGQLGVIAAMQGVHCTSDAPYVLARLGPKRAEEGAYVWQKLMKTGAVITNGTDAPVEDVDPIASYYATVTRRLKDGSVFFGDQKMSRMEALKSYTINGAYAGFEEGLKGSLTPGKLADVTVLSKDILTVPDEEIRAGEGALHDRRRQGALHREINHRGGPIAPARPRSPGSARASARPRHGHALAGGVRFRPDRGRGARR